ncbi:hypothetical protein LXN10_07585 [Arcobacter sp. KX21116]|uniref:hypothetical protein n=1 Tax=Arcobacter iocasae TaxID=2906515 RepID=UPI0035D49E98
MIEVKNFFFLIFKWIIKLFNVAFISVFTIFVIVFLIELINNLPILKKDITYDPVAISNTFIVYVTFIVVIGTIALTLAGFYFQRSIAKREGEILNENMEKVLDAITTDKDQFREKLVIRILEHKNIKPLIQEKLDRRVESYEVELNKQKNLIKELKESVSSLAEGFNNLSTESSKEIKFDLSDKEDEK